jgi:hypothetical protein
VSILYYIGILYFPGTLLHELSHFLAAVILRVPVASFSIMPKVTPTGILFGRVSVQKVDPFRSAIIAIAPLLTGAISLLFVLNWIKANAKLDVVTLLACYFALCLINMMIPSKQDVKVALPGIVIITAIVVGIYLLFFMTRTSLY